MRKVMFDINRKHVISSYKAGPEYLISSSFVFCLARRIYIVPRDDLRLSFWKALPAILTETISSILGSC